SSNRKSSTSNDRRAEESWGLLQKLLGFPGTQVTSLARRANNSARPSRPSGVVSPTRQRGSRHAAQTTSLQLEGLDLAVRQRLRHRFLYVAAGLDDVKLLVHLEEQTILFDQHRSHLHHVGAEMVLDDPLLWRGQ